MQDKVLQRVKTSFISKPNQSQLSKSTVQPAETMIKEIIKVEQFVVMLPASAKDWVLCHEVATLDKAVCLMEVHDSAWQAAYPMGQVPKSRKETNKEDYYRQCQAEE